jgi:hypothetical protein
MAGGAAAPSRAQDHSHVIKNGPKCPAAASNLLAGQPQVVYYYFINQIRLDAASRRLRRKDL